MQLAPPRQLFVRTLTAHVARSRHRDQTSEAFSWVRPQCGSICQTEIERRADNAGHPNNMAKKKKKNTDIHIFGQFLSVCQTEI